MCVYTYSITVFFDIWYCMNFFLSDVGKNLYSKFIYNDKLTHKSKIKITLELLSWECENHWVTLQVPLVLLFFIHVRIPPLMAISEQYLQYSTHWYLNLGSWTRTENHRSKESILKVKDVEIYFLRCTFITCYLSIPWVVYVLHSALPGLWIY